MVAAEANFDFFILAKHLESLKDGRFPIEILSRGKEAEENEKLWKTITDKINESGVSGLSATSARHFANQPIENRCHYY